MTETVDIKIDLSADYWDERYPGARVYIDSQLIFNDIIIDATQVTWSGELAEGDHKIIVEMYDKKWGDTVTDENNNIVKDVILNIDNISIDTIDLGILLWTKSTYYPVDGIPRKSLDNCVNLGWNGKWEIGFESPVYMWLLENI